MNPLACQSMQCLSGRDEINSRHLDVTIYGRHSEDPLRGVMILSLASDRTDALILAPG